jgi:hypothetical protein
VLGSQHYEGQGRRHALNTCYVGSCTFSPVSHGINQVSVGREEPSRESPAEGSRHKQKALLPGLGRGAKVDTVVMPRLRQRKVTGGMQAHTPEVQSSQLLHAMHDDRLDQWSHSYKMLQAALEVECTEDL